jgi:hypothetical protein
MASGPSKSWGATIAGYRDRFELRYRNRHKLPPSDYPMDRVVSGEAFTGLVVEVGPAGEEKRWVHQVRSLVLTDAEGQPDRLVLISERILHGSDRLAAGGGGWPRRT